MSLHPLREPALLIAGLLAPLVQTGLLIWGGLSPQAQAVWNAATVAVAGVVIAALTAKDRLAPAVLGLSAAVVALFAHYGWHLSVEAETAVAASVSLVMAAFLRTQITAPIDADGARAGPQPEQRRTVADLVAKIGPKTAPIDRVREEPENAEAPAGPPPPRAVVQVPQAPWYAEPNRPGQEGHGMRG